MHHYSKVPISLLLFVLASISLSAALGQESAGWQTLKPDNEQFTVMMPKDSSLEEVQEPFHRMTLNARYYLSKSNAGPVLAVVSISGIKSNPAAYTELQRFNSYVDAFKTLFPSRVRGKDAVVKLTLSGPKTLNNTPGREYQVTIGDLSGTAQTFLTRKRFYAIVALNTKKDEALNAQFLSSFTLPEYVAPAPIATRPGTPAAIAGGDDTTVTATVNNPRVKKRTEASDGAEDGQKPEHPTDANSSDNKPADDNASADNSKPADKAPINGGVMNNKAINLPPPQFPSDIETTGTVVVQVVIDEAGNVVTARAVSGPAPLRAAAVEAAKQATFAPTLLSGVPVRVSGVLTYTR